MARNATEEEERVFGGGELTLGIILGLAGAALLALSMVVQRHALSYPEKSMAPLFPRCNRGPRVPRLAVWVWGLVLYGTRASSALLSLASPTSTLPPCLPQVLPMG